MKSLGNPSGKVLRAARKTFEQVPLASSHDALAALLAQFVGKEGLKGAKPEDDAALKAVLDGRKKHDEAGVAASRATTVEVTKRLHELHPELGGDDGREK